MAEKPRVRVKAGRVPLTTDSFANVIAHLGQRTNNISAGADYGLDPISRMRTRLDFMYRGSWLVRKVVDQPANDMTRAGFDMDTGLPPQAVEKILTTWRKLRLWDSLRNTIKWARLYGGAVAMVLIDGQDPATPLRVDTVRPGSFKGLLVLDRWMVNPILTLPIQELGPKLGQPSMYETTTTSDIPSMHIHHSRLIRFDGDPLPYWQSISENGWSVSVVEQLYDRMVAFDSATQGAAQLVYKAHLRTYKVDGLRELIANGGAMYHTFLESMNLVRMMQTNEGLTIVDKDDEIEYHTNSAFSGLSDALTQFGQQLSGASGIPLVVLFGQSPSGFSTGETDVRNYYDRISAQQHSDLEEPVRMLLSVITMSLFGKPMPADMGFTFNSLWQFTEKERAETANSIVNTVVAAHGEGLVSTQTAMKELKQSSRETGMFTNISDEEIAAAEDTLPMPGMEMPGQEGGAPGAIPEGGVSSGAPKPAGPPQQAKGSLQDGGKQPARPAAPEAGEKPSSPVTSPPGIEKDAEGKMVVQGTPSNVRIRLDPSVAHLLKLNGK